MRGNNEMILNGATVIAALQEYFDKRITTPKVKVTTVTSKGDSTFSVKFEELKENQANTN